MVDVLVVGGGVIGLTSAWFLAQRGLKVALLDKGQPGMGASWAGAGIIPPGNFAKANTPNDKLRGRGYHLHPILHQKLLEETGIDNGFRVSGGLEFFLDGQGPNRERVGGWEKEGIEFKIGYSIDRASYPNLNLPENGLTVSFPQMAQVRNPRHLRALIQSALQSGVEIYPEMTISHLDTSGDRISSIRTANGKSIFSDKVLFATGAWTGLWDTNFPGLDTKIQPVRGQMIQFNCTESRNWPIIEVGKRYMVPRGDGVLLVGSTEEMAGFDCATTPSGLEALSAFARTLAPCLSNRAHNKSWAGLRPWAPRGIPFIGKIPCFSNAFINAGHFRWGLQFSPAASEISTAQILGEPLGWINLDTFDSVNPPPFEESLLFMS